MRVSEAGSITSGALTGRFVKFVVGATQREHEIFALVPDAFGNELSDRDDIFLPALIMTALVIGEDLDLDGLSVDPLLLRNCLAAARQHHDWVGRFRVPTVLKGRPAAAARPASPRIASFFSGGIDSLFTLARHSGAFSADPTRVSPQDISLALHVFHSSDRTALSRNPEAESVLGRGAAALGARFVPVFSNIMTFEATWLKNYARVTHGSGLAAIGRVVSAGLSACLIGSSHTYGSLHAWGSSPLVDPLFSGNDLQVVHDGSTFTRFEKTQLIANSPAALAVVNVCDTLTPGRGYVNCSRCQKCLRTMTAFDLCGMGGAASPAFDWSDYKPTQFGEIFFKNWSERSFANELEAAARQQGRLDMANAIHSAIARSRWLSPMAALEDKVRHTALASRHKPMLTRLRAGAYRSFGLRR